MKSEVLHLKDYFPFLGEEGRDPLLEINLRYNMTEMNRENEKRPCLIICPGGAYQMCSQREMEPIAAHFLPDGYNTFSLLYSLKPNRFPTQIREVAAVMELIYKNADEWNCDTSRIAIIGFSAGGHLAAHYSNAYNCPEVREVFPESKSVNASILCYPVITAEKEFTHTGSMQNLLGHIPNQEETQKFSCEKLVNANTPPAFIWHTAEDNAVPVRNSLEYANALSKYKIPFELRIYPYGEHGLATADLDTNFEICDGVDRVQEWIPAAKSWLKLMFK
ncbi:MAG: alpha/beta hydrolase [Clostridia bacterium]|nr:alpha/beta hydrolase [Clostridia bacterium]